jgi:hypothetical protein
MRNLLDRINTRATVAAGTTAMFLAAPAASFAAADPTTGIDYQTDLADPALDAIKPAILAGVAVLVVFAAVAGGKKMWGKVTGAK